MPPIATANSGNIVAPHRATPFLEPAAARQRVGALSVDEALLQRLPVIPQHFCVHSVFERVINLDAGGGRLLTLANRDADDAPDSIVIDLHSWSAFGLAAGTGAHVSRRHIDLGRGLRIALAGARPWQGRLPTYARDESMLRGNYPLAQGHLECRGSGIGIRRALAADRGSLDRALAAAFHVAAEGLCRALTLGDKQTAQEQVCRLLGLGTGLTPSGDDFLLGLLAALNIPDSPGRELRHVGSYAIECAEAQTHRISAAALRHAANGRVRARIIGLCDALMYASSADMLQALDEVIRIGSGSGSEIALGVLAGFRLHLGRQPCRWPDARNKPIGVH